MSDYNENSVQGTQENLNCINPLTKKNSEIQKMNKKGSAVISSLFFFLMVHLEYAWYSIELV